METPELQIAFDQLTADHITLAAEKDDLQKRFDQTASFILDLQAKHAEALKAEQDDHAATKVQRDTFKKGFETQSRNHEAAMQRVKELTAPLAPVPAPADGPA